MDQARLLCGDSLQGLDAGVVLPDETLKLGRTISQLRGGFREDLVALGLGHVVGFRLAPLAQLVSLDKRAGKRIELLELEVTRRLIITEGRSDRQVLGSSIKDDTCRLGLGRAHPNSSHVDGIVARSQGHLQSKVVLVVFGLISSLGHKLFLSALRAALQTLVEAKLVGGIDAHVRATAQLEQGRRVLRHLREALGDVTVLNLAQLGKIVSLKFDVNLAIVLLGLFEVFNFHMRDVVLFQVDSDYLVASGGGFDITRLLIGRHTAGAEK